MKSLIAGFIFMIVLIGSISWYFVDNYSYKHVTAKNGERGVCQVIRYRFWYEIRNCSNPSLNQTIVGLNQIGYYQVQ